MSRMLNCNVCNQKKCCCKTVKVVQANGFPSRLVTGKRGLKGDSVPTTLPIQNTAFVSKNGNDTTGLVERLDKPFLTISAAILALNTAYPTRTSAIRYLVKVFPGTYDEDIILKPYIDIDLGNAQVDGEITDNQVDFGSSGDNVWTNIIYGRGIIHNTTDIGGGRTHALQIYKPNTKLLINCAQLSSQNDNAIAICNGRIRICGPVQIFTNETVLNYAIPLELTQGGVEANYTFSLVEVFDGDIFNLSDSQCPPIGFTFGAANKNQKLVLINCRVANNNDQTDGDGSCISVGDQSASNGKLSLFNTTMYSKAGASIYIAASQTLTSKFYHSNMVNTAVAGAGTHTIQLGSLTVNAAVAAEY